MPLDRSKHAIAEEAEAGPGVEHQAHRLCSLQYLPADLKTGYSSKVGLLRRCCAVISINCALVKRVRYGVSELVLDRRIGGMVMDAGTRGFESHVVEDDRILIVKRSQ